MCFAIGVIFIFRGCGCERVNEALDKCMARETMGLCSDVIKKDTIVEREEKCGKEGHW
jgi:hypothetical protein